MIELPSRAVRDYPAQFGVTAIYITSSGSVGAGRDLSRAAPVATAWWVRDRRTAEQILMTIAEQQPVTIAEAARAVQAAADRLGAILSEHSAVMARAKAAVAKMGARLAVAQQTGTLVFFNREYQRRRLAARVAGARFMSYGEAQWRLRKVLAAAAADGSMPALMQQVFGSDP